MQVSEFIGKKVVDNKGMEIGKISDVDIMPIEGLVSSITVSTGDTLLRTKSLEIKPDDIKQVGDYVLINLNTDSIEKKVEEKKETNEEKPKTRITLTK